ncbi:uncharacterized protein METZ01_LOCUS51775 [marine metagenome]|uniref:Uncharacterized protein n=1 Tax=marine metagenome TaxID=408172 RepID=A0A381S6I8_9ZZZZ
MLASIRDCEATYIGNMVVNCVAPKQTYETVLSLSIRGRQASTGALTPEAACRAYPACSLIWWVIQNNCQRTGSSGRLTPVSVRQALAYRGQDERRYIGCAARHA